MTNPAYRLECDLVSDLCLAIGLGKAPWPDSTSLAHEFNYQRGRTDVIAVTSPNYLIAFEAKLSNWREALQQAYRNTCFAHESYVVVPRDVARIAGSFAAEFERRAVGLCYCESDGVTILIPAKPQVPLQDWLLERAIDHVSSSNDDAR